jgi:hypothetical protein
MVTSHPRLNRTISLYRARGATDIRPSGRMPVQNLGPEHFLRFARRLRTLPLPLSVGGANGQSEKTSSERFLVLLRCGCGVGHSALVASPADRRAARRGGSGALPCRKSPFWNPALESPGKTLIEIREAKQAPLRPRILHSVCLGERLRSAFTPMLRIGLTGHLSPHLNCRLVREPAATLISKVYISLNR